MRVFVRHRTDYRYSVPVQLAPHVLRLNPRRDGVRVLSHTTQVQPWPWTRSEQLDPFGNRVTLLAFHGTAQQLSIDSQLDVETSLPTPLMAAGWPALPWSRPSFSSGIAELAAYAYPEPGPAHSVIELGVQRFAQDLAARAGMQVLPFLDLLTQTVFERTRQQSRLAGDARPAALTLAQGEGSCRDVAVLFMDACRALGLVSRFTSGYAVPIDNADLPRDLHAWPEVFLPGVGFRGWDPAQGRRVSDAHVSLCSAPTQAATLPVEGGYSFIGSSVNTTLDYDIRIRVLT